MILWPPKQCLQNNTQQQATRHLAHAFMQPNNLSCVIAVYTPLHPENSALLTGDIQRIAEKAIVNTYPVFFSHNPLHTLVSPHHGSLTSSSQLFLQSVKPHRIIISSGFLNRFRLPHPRILDRYKQYGVPVYNTAYQGAIHWHPGCQWYLHKNCIQTAQHVFFRFSP